MINCFVNPWWLQPYGPMYDAVMASWLSHVIFLSRPGYTEWNIVLLQPIIYSPHIMGSSACQFNLFAASYRLSTNEKLARHLRLCCASQWLGKGVIADVILYVTFNSMRCFKCRRCFLTEISKIIKPSYVKEARGRETFRRSICRATPKGIQNTTSPLFKPHPLI